jgi:hypothetical protein
MPTRITFGEMRASGTRDVLIYAATITAAITLRSMLTAGPITSGSPTSSRRSCAPTAGHCGAELRPKFQAGQVPDDGLTTGPVERASLWPSLRRLAAFVKQAISRTPTASRARQGCRR